MVNPNLQRMPNFFERGYIFLTKWFSTTFIGILIGILIGVITSAFVNILTGEKQLSVYFAVTVGLYFILCILLYRLLLFRQALDENDSQRKENQVDDRLRWRISCDWDRPGNLKRFYMLFILTSLSLGGAIGFNMYANSQQLERDRGNLVSVDWQPLTREITSLRHEIVRGNIKIERLRVVQDSLMAVVLQKEKKILLGKSSRSSTAVVKNPH